MGRRYPLTPQQHDLWLAQAMAGDSPAFTIPLWVELPAQTDPELFRRALLRLTAEAPVLRTRLHLDGEKVLQSFPEDNPPSLEQVDLSNRAEPEAAARELVERLKAKPFALAGQPLCRWTLISLGPKRHAWLWLIHHLAIDAWGTSLLIQRLAALYDAMAAGAEPPPADFAHPGELAEASSEPEPGLFWQQRLARLPAPLFGRRTGDTRARNLRLAMPRSLHAELAGLAADRGAGTSRLYLLLLAALLARLHGRRELAVGVTFLNRPGPEHLRCPGMFVNELPLVVPASPDAPFGELLAETSREVSAVKAAPQVSLAALRGLAGLEPVTSLFDLALSYVRQQSHVPLAGGLALTRKLLPGHSLLPLVLSVNQLDRSSNLEFNLEAQAHLVSGPEAASLHPRFLALCRSVLDRPDAPLAELELMPPEERRLVMRDWAQGPPPVPHQPSLDAAFARASAAAPRATALFHGAEQVSYARLDAMAGAAAAGLAALGVGPGMRVGLSAPASPALVAGILGANRIGAAFVLLPPELPPARLAAMAQEADLTAMAVWAAQPPPGCFGLPLLDLGDLAPGQTNPQPPPDPDADAYVWFTSGTTGRPKGVVVPNRAIAHKVAATIASLGGPSRGPIPVSASQSYDPFLIQVFCGLVGGGGARLLSGAERRDPERFWSQVAAGSPCWLNTVPSLLAGLLPSAPPEALPSHILLGGEELTMPVARACRQRFPHATLHNFYGPTEATVDAVGIEVDLDDPAERIPIGRPLPGYLVRILDQKLRPVPPGVAGELCIGGPFLARGYLGLPQETARAFVADPYSPEPGARLYRTGDAARWRFDGLIEYLGRLDQQLKLAGVRIEPGDVEAALVRHPAVARAVAAADDLPGGGRRLVAYLVPADPGSPPRAGELRRFLAGLLPATMLPAAYKLVESIPLGPTGKTDRRALAASAAVDLAAEEPAGKPRTENERLVADIWAQVLGLERVDPEATFFEAGGTSLLLLTLHRRLGELPGYALSLPELMRRPTVRGVAARLEPQPIPDGPLARITEVLARVLGQPVGPDDSLLELGADSMALARCLSSLRRELGLNLSVPELLKAASPRGMAAKMDSGA